MTRLYHIEAFSILRDGVRQLAESDPALSYVGAAGNHQVVMEEGPPAGTDVVLIDLDFYRETAEPLAKCLLLCTGIRQKHPGIGIILHSPYKYAMWIHRFAAAGVRGFVSKYSGFDMIKQSVREVVLGRFFMCPLMAQQFSNYDAFEKDPTTVLRLRTPNFSPRELEVLEGLLRGESTRTIADSMFISERTVETHRKNLVGKAGVHNTVELVNFVSVRGLRLA